MADGEQLDPAIETAAISQEETPEALRAMITRLQNEKAALSTERDSYRGQVSDRDRRLTSETAGRFQAEETAIENAITANTNKLSGLKAQLAAAFSEGKHEDAADIQTQISQVAAELHGNNQQKNWVAQQKERAAAMPAQPSDPREAFIASYPENVRPWIRQNARFIDDAGYRNVVHGLHNLATAKNLQPGSADYFKFIEERAAQELGEKPAATHAAPAIATATAESPLSQPQEVEMPADSVVIGNAEQPQTRAAGTGSLASVGARVTRTSTGASPRAQAPRLTQEQADMATAYAASNWPDLTNPADIYKRWYDLSNSPTARRIKDGWAA